MVILTILGALIMFLVAKYIMACIREKEIEELKKRGELEEYEEEQEGGE